MTRNSVYPFQPKEAPVSKPGVIFADLLIPGRGTPIKGGALVFESKTILFAGAQKDLPAKYAHLQHTSVPVLMPGMWDCHTHYMGADTFDFSQILGLSPALAGAREVRALMATLNAGFTSVRECGGIATDIGRAIDENWLVGPKVYGCGAALSQTAGHGDLHNLPLSAVQDYCHSISPATKVVDGVDECIKAVRENIRRGAAAIKIHITGGVLSQLDNPQHQQFSNREITAMVEEANRAGLAVCTHAHGKAGIMTALNSGVHTIEHGSYLDEEACDLMLEKGAMLVATRSIVEFGIAHLSMLPTDEMREKMKETSIQQKKAYALAIKKGVKCALGTDMGIASNTFHFNHGMNGQEFYWATEAGMTPLQAIEAGTANAPEVLGKYRAPKSGQLKEGFDADFIALSASPLDDIKVLAEASNVTHVWKAGVLVKEPGRLVGLLG